MTGPSIRIGALPVNNATDPDVHYTIDGWYGTAAPRAELEENGAIGGAIAVGPWEPAEAYYTLSGLIHSTDRQLLLDYRRQLLAALPAGRDMPLVVIGNGEDIDLTVYVRRYDKPDINFDGHNLVFSYPLVASDPYKYGSDLLEQQMGVFTGSAWFRTYLVDTAPTPDLYYRVHSVDLVPFPNLHYRTYEQADESSEFPPAAILTSTGDSTSRRVVARATGPLTRGDWAIVNEATGAAIWADLDLAPGQTARFDSLTQTATLDGAAIDSYVFGDFLTLEPGVNTYRLIAGIQTAGFGRITAQPAYE